MRYDRLLSLLIRPGRGKTLSSPSFCHFLVFSPEGPIMDGRSFLPFGQCGGKRLIVMASHPDMIIKSILEELN